MFHLTAPDPEFLFDLTQFAFDAPIPPGTPDHEPGSHFVPGTGPYKIVSASDTQIRFTRNPYFREWSHAAQPAGNPGAIVTRAVACLCRAAVGDPLYGHRTDREDDLRVCG